MSTIVLKKQDFKILEGSVLNQEVALTALNTSNFVFSRYDPTVVYVSTIGTFMCCGGRSKVLLTDFEAQAKKQGFDSQVVIYQFRLNAKKDLVLEKKGRHRFFMQQNNRKMDNSMDSVLKESADGTSLIFSFGRNCSSLSFDLHSLQLSHFFQHRVEDILGSSVLLKLEKGGELKMSELSKLDEEPKPLSLKDKISNENLLDYV